MIIDSHHHLWRLSRGDYGWLSPDLRNLWRDFEPADLAPLMASAGVAGGIVVQAAPTGAETSFLLDLAACNPMVLGVVGWADLTAPDAPEAIRQLAADPTLKGLRPMLQDIEDDAFILRPEVEPALRAMSAAGLRFEALVRPRHLPVLRKLRDRHPDLPIILNHAGKPDIASDDWASWAEDLTQLAADGLTVCKLSGLITEAGPDWDVDRLRPIADRVIDAFGPGRVMWGSDWPVALLAGTYSAWLDAAKQLLDRLTAPERAAILGGTAARVYGIAETGVRR